MDGRRGEPRRRGRSEEEDFRRFQSIREKPDFRERERGFTDGLRVDNFGFEGIEEGIGTFLVGGRVSQ